MAERGIIGTTAVVLAGGPADDLSAKTPGAPNKAFVAIDGVALVERTMRALKSASSISRIIVVAPERVHGHPALALADEQRPDGARIRESLSNGLRGLAPDTDVLVSTSDLPVLTAEAIDDYVIRAHEKDADLTYGCLERRVHLAKYPDVPHTWAPLRDGTFCGTGFVTIRPRIWPSLERFIEQLGHARKNPLQLARLFGWNVLLRFATRRLTIAAAEARASHVIGARVRAVISPYPEIGVNVDRVSDIALAEKLVRSRASAGSA
jgi:molybdopterin-guanine dinucleotide biosynthesis protein A